MALLPFGTIAVIEVQGTIGRGVRPETHLPLLEKVQKGRRYKALVLIVNTPGGSAPAAEEIYHAVSRIAEKKPVVAFVRGLCASGGLYISLGAHKVVSLRNAAIGSIGVMFTRLVAHDLMQKVGLSMVVYKSAEHKDMFAPWRGPTPEENAKMQALVSEVYERFVNVVAEKRNLDREKARMLATGELFSAAKAKEAGLIDEIGDLERALDLAAEMAGIKRRVRYLRPPRPRFPLLRGAFAQELTQSVLEEVDRVMVGRLWM